MKALHVHLIRGLPGSGKSTRARAYAARGYVHIEADDFFVSNGRYVFDPTKLPQAHASCRQRVAAALAAGRNVVVANTFSRRWEMGPYWELAALYGARVTEETMRGQYQNAHGVPAEAIAAMRERWE